MEIKHIERGDTASVMAASALFDEPARPEYAERFLDSPGHFLFIAYEAGAPAGFVSGVEMIHPDKGAEMFLYELDVAEPFRRRGVATALVARLRDFAQERECYAMWVLTDAENDAAIATYRRAGAGAGSAEIMFDWRFGAPGSD